MLAIQKNQEMLQTKNELLKKAEEKRKSAMAQQGGILKSKRVRIYIEEFQNIVGCCTFSIKTNLENVLWMC